MTEEVQPPEVGDPNAVYALGSSRGETARLHQQADELAAHSLALLEPAGLRTGQAAIDVGCGPRGILELLSERVLPGGRVVGLDSTPLHVAIAEDLVARRGLMSRWCARTLARRGCRRALVHARTLLINVPEPESVLAEMVRLARPGGWVLGAEPDGEYGLCYPAHPAFDRLHELFIAAFARHGADPRIGRRLVELYRQAGLEEVTVEVRADLYPPGHTRRTIRADLVRAMRSQIVEVGLASERELEQLDVAVRAHLEDPDTIVMGHLFFLASGRKPRED